MLYSDAAPKIRSPNRLSLVSFLALDIGNENIFFLMAVEKFKLIRGINFFKLLIKSGKTL